MTEGTGDPKPYGQSAWWAAGVHVTSDGRIWRQASVAKWSRVFGGGDAVLPHLGVAELGGLLCVWARATEPFQVYV